jgi:hypothetical protein
MTKLPGRANQQKPVQPHLKKYFAVLEGQISGVMCTFRTHKRGARDRHERWVWNAMDADALLTNSA